MIRNAIRHGAIAFGAAMSAGAAAYSARDAAEIVACFVIGLAILFGALAAMAHSEPA
jgi:hypothetical protein